MIEKIEGVVLEEFPVVTIDCVTGKAIAVIACDDNFEFLVDHHNALVRKFNELAEVVNKLSSTGIKTHPHIAND